MTFTQQQLTNSALKVLEETTGIKMPTLEDDLGWVGRHAQARVANEVTNREQERILRIVAACREMIAHLKKEICDCGTGIFGDGSVRLLPSDHAGRCAYRNAREFLAKYGINS